MRKFIQYLALILVVGLTAGGLTTLLFRQQLLTPATYTEAIAQSGLYSITSDMITTKVTAYLVGTQKQLVGNLAANTNPANPNVAKIEPVVVVFLNSLIDRETGTVVQKVANDVQLDKTLMRVTNNGINRIILWFAGERPDPKFLAYIPEPQQLAEVKAQGPVNFLVKQLKDQVGIQDLPACTSTDQVTQNLKRLATGQVKEIDCYSPEIRAIVDKTAQVVVPQMAQTQLALTLNSYLDKYQIRSLANDVFNALMQISQYKQQILTIKADLVNVGVAAERALAWSVVFLVIGLALTEKRKLRTLMMTYLSVGGVMVVGSVIYIAASTQAVAQAIPKQVILITDPAFSESQKVQLSASLKTAANLIVKELASSTLFTGLSIILITLLGLTVLYLMEKNRQAHQLAAAQTPSLFDEPAEPETKPVTSKKVNKKKTK